MLATINRVTTGVCIWCCQPADDAIEATFKDGLKGTFCRKHFWEALKSRSEQAPAATEQRTPPAKSAS